MINKRPWKVIFYRYITDRGIIRAKDYYDEPQEEDIKSLMKDFNSPFAELYYDKYDTEEYDWFVSEYKLD